MTKIINLSLPVLLIACVVVNCSLPPATVYDLRCENLTNPLSIDNHAPYLSWRTNFGKTGGKPVAYQLLAATDSTRLRGDRADLCNTGKVAWPLSVMVPWPGKALQGRMLVYWCVRVWDEKGKVSPWSKTACFGTPLSESELQEAAYIGFPEKAGNPQSPLLRKSFEWNDDGKCLLYVNSLGYQEVYLNGKKVGEQILAPAVTQMDKRSLYLAYDLSPYLNRGSNDLVLWLGQGWYRPGLPGAVYEGPLVKARLDRYRHAQWQALCQTDTSWQAAESGFSSIGSWQWQQFGGERVDASAVPANMSASALDRLKWRPAVAVQVPEHAVSPQMTESNHITETFQPVGVKKLSDSVWLADMGKNMTGWAKIRFAGLRKGQEITMEYSDQLDGNGTIVHQEQKDTYIASGAKEELFCNKFAYHGFQYIRISGIASLSPDDITACFIRTGFGGDASSFQCSDPDMNAIHDMIQYTLQCLSLGGIMVDCPHLERLGYGGDGSASTATAQTMFNLSPLYTNWLAAWADCQHDDGWLPYAAPYPYWCGGGPYYSGFMITASWQTYLNYGDTRLIEKYYPAMQRWLDYVEKYSPNGLLEPWPDKWYLGDWAGPDGLDQTDRRTVDLVNNSFISTSYRMMEKIALRLGKNGDAQRYDTANERLKKKIHEQFYDHDRHLYATGSQIDLAFPLLAGVTPPHLVAEVTQSLVRETENRKGHLACGLVGIPVLTEWAIRNHRPDFIYGMLKKKDYPGYLYMIENGATTTWEHWENWKTSWSRSRIHNCYNGIGLWFYQAIGGIRPDEDEPGYRKIWIDPQIPEGVTWSKTSKDTPYGRLSLDWTLTGHTLELSLTVPPGSVACVVLPGQTSEYVLNGKKSANNREHIVTVENGLHQITYSFPSK
ncbi:MAG: glycoside hydrolase family 78 protein [Bacteroidales bacterium]|jgi:alpha-L-rhamnosidase|nr:glycoside hydrolase family 78 protein [Bacteroidales bacterium]